MEQQRGFMTLACPKCECTVFMLLVQLKHRPGSGLVRDEAGYGCLNCHTKVDAQEALNAYQLKLKRDELRMLEDELGVSHATTRSPLPGEDDREREEDTPRVR